MSNLLKGKDCPLEDSLERFKSFLQVRNIEIVEQQWKNPLPNVWSVHIADKEFPFLYTNGKGSSKLAALVSAYGEFIERYSTKYMFADYYWKTPLTQRDENWVFHPQERWIEVSEEFPHSILSRSLERFYKQEGEVKFSMLLDRNLGDRGVCCLPFVRQRDGREVYIPQNILNNLYVSNGMSCGNSLAEAKVQALGEIIERGIKSKIIAEKLTLPLIPEDYLKKYPQLLEGIEKLQQKGFEVQVRDASLGGKYPVVNITLLNREDGGVYCAFGAHPCFSIALERTLTELLQGRDLDQLNGFRWPSCDSNEVSSVTNLEEHFIDSSGVIHWKFLALTADFPFVPWGEEIIPLDNEQLWVELLGIIHQQQYEVYLCDYSFCGEAVVRIIIPGLSEIYLIEDLYQNNNSELLPLCTLFQNLHQLSQDESCELLRLLDQQAFPSAALVSESFGFIFLEGSFWAKINIGQLRALLLLVNGEEEAALDELAMVDTGDLWWRILFALLEMKTVELDQYHELLTYVDMDGKIQKQISQLISRRELALLPPFDWSFHQRLVARILEFRP